MVPFLTCMVLNNRVIQQFNANFSYQNGFNMRRKSIGNVILNDMVLLTYLRDIEESCFNFFSIKQRDIARKPKETETLYLKYLNSIKIHQWLPFYLITILTLLCSETPIII